MARKLRTYEAENIVVEYDARRCIHAAECVRGLPTVFDPDARPWIDPTRAGADEVARVVERCPTGALHYRRSDGGAEERAPDANTVTVGAEGPLYLKGRLRIALPSGETLEETRAALCRCGHSKDKPFCDDSHFDAGFDDPGVIVEARLKEADDEATDWLEVAPAPNGPILLRGAVEVRGQADTRVSGAGGALCRCGQSSTKPFCDGTHKTVGFEAG